jgi:hypothetical protein
MPSYLIDEFKEEGYFDTLDALRSGSARAPQDTKTPKAAGTAPEGIDQDVWDALTPTQRKLWN